MAANDSKETEKLEESVITEASGGMLDTVNRKPLAPLMDAPAPKTEGGGWLAFGGAAFGLLWFGGAAAYLAGYTDLTALSPAQLAGLSVFAAAPALLFVLAGLLGREVSRAGSRARRLDAAVLRLATRPSMPKRTPRASQTPSPCRSIGSTRRWKAPWRVLRPWKR